jgi:bacterioferritin
MKGNLAIINALNGLLAYELAAIDQYFIHSEMYDDWGFKKLSARIAHEANDEKGHAQGLIARILFLEGKPDMETRDGLNIGNDVIGMLQSDLDVEYAVAKALKIAIQLCEQQQDFVTRAILEKLLDDTEQDHAHWLEQQLSIIQKIGLQNYLQAQM